MSIIFVIKTIWNLQKVFNTKLNEWYIKTLANKEKINNLG